MHKEKVQTTVYLSVECANKLNTLVKFGEKSIFVERVLNEEFERMAKEIEENKKIIFNELVEKMTIDELAEK